MIFSLLTSNTKHFLTNSATNTAVLYLFVQLITHGICEISPAYAIYKSTYYINCMLTANLIFCAILSIKPRVMWKYKKSQNHQSIEILYKLFKIIAHEDVCEFLKSNILTLCLDDLFSDGHHLIEESTFLLTLT